MPLVSTSIPNLLNGVSQQPSAMRQLTQGESQINALSSVVDGLIKRPPSDLIAKLSSSLPGSNIATHIIDRGDNGKHSLIVLCLPPSNVFIYLYDIDNGNAVTLNASNTDKAYLYSDNPQKDLKFLTVADFTFVVNKSKTVAMSTATTPGTLVSEKYQEFADLPVEHSTIYVGDGNTTLFNISFNYGTQSDVKVKVDDVVQTSGFSFTSDGNQVKFASAPANGANILIYEEPTAGRYYEVIGDQNNAFDNYYVKSLSGTAYEETVKPGITYQFDATTMPHAIVPGSSAFTLQQITWGERTAGDLDSAPDPSIVGSKINDIFFFKNRLGFLSSENIVMSAAGDFYRFFPETVTTILADSPIDVSISHTKVSLLEHAVAFNETLTLFSDATQFIIDSEGNLTPQTISISPSTEFESDIGVAPVGAGTNLYFPSKKGEFSSIREYYIQSDTVIRDALEVSAHIPKYVPKNIVKMATSSNEDILVCLSSEDRSKLFVYKWYNDGEQKLQSSWSQWQFDVSTASNAGIYDIKIIENDLYLVIIRGDGVFLEKMSLQYPNDSGLDFNVRADRKTSLTGTYSSGTGLTTWTLPYEYDGNMIVVKSGSWPSRKGVDISNSRPNATTITAVGDYSSQPVIVGVPYTFSYQFSAQHVRENNGQQAVQSGRLQLRTMRVNYEDTGYFKVQVTPNGRATNEYEFTGVILNQLNSTIEDVNLSDGTFRFPVQSKNDRVNITITSDNYLPCAFQNAEWEGFYTIRSQRI